MEFANQIAVLLCILTMGWLSAETKHVISQFIKVLPIGLFALNVKIIIMTLKDN
jgi:hypothetical protein